MTKNWLKNAVIQVNTPKNSIIGILRANIGGLEPGRSMSVVHASDITKSEFCPRRWAFFSLHDKDTPPQFLPTALKATFDVGRMTAKLLIEQWAGDAAVGNWQCVRCGGQRTLTKKPIKTGCHHGGEHIWEYVEVQIDMPEYDVSGSIDCLFDVGTPQWLVTELKILSPDDFADIVAPRPEHRIRTNLYMKLIAGSQHPYKDRFNVHEARVLYVSRNHGKKNPDWNGEILPFKEFKVERDDEVLLPMLKKAKQLKIFRDSKLMPSGICATALDKVAKGCQFCKHCFSGEYPSQQEALL